MMKKYALYFLLLASLLSSCIGEDFVEEVELFEPKFSITNGSISGIDSLLVGDSIEYIPAYFNQQGREEAAEVSWKSSRPNVATVDKNGKVTALSVGVTNITARANGLEDEQLIVVQEFERIEISSSITDLVKGDEVTVTATYYNRNNQPTAISLNWSSSNNAIVTINNAGKITAVAKGSAEVTASANGIVSNAISINVSDVERIELSTTKSMILIGEELMMTSTYFDPQGNQATTNLNWSSSNETVAMVDNSGKVLGISSGQTQVRASINNVLSNIITIDVIEDTTTVTDIQIFTTSNTIEIGNSLTFTAELRNINGNLLTNIPVQWNVSDPSVLSVDANGVVTGITAGSSDVSAMAQGVQSQSTNILVTTPIVNSRSGSFQNANGYTVNGSVEIRRQSNNDVVLNFSSFSSDPSGNLFIYLTNGANSISGGINLGRLNFRNGTFSVPVPVNVGVNDYDYVVIWCRAVGQSFGAAQLN